jgi:vacuolar-type H+-ATPase subunit H
MDTRMGNTESVESAITRVLRAEQEALAAIAACESEAEDIQRDARQAARSILRRTRERLSRLHAACAARTRELIDEIERGAVEHSASAAPDDGERQLLEAAIRSLARELTSRDTR